MAHILQMAHDMKAKCPINGCGYSFAYGVLGWDAHVSRIENHPEYHPLIVIPENRKRAFQRDFPQFFDQAKIQRTKSGIMARVTVKKQA